jgi:hypothetical protein
VAEMKREREDPKQPELSAENYYDYEARFVKQKREQERINVLPRVIKPAMFAKGEFALGDMRVFSRYTVAPLSSLTCGFVELKPGAHSDPKRMVPSAMFSREAESLFRRTLDSRLRPETWLSFRRTRRINLPRTPTKGFAPGCRK